VRFSSHRFCAFAAPIADAVPLAQRLRFLHREARSSLSNRGHLHRRAQPRLLRRLPAGLCRRHGHAARGHQRAVVCATVPLDAQLLARVAVLHPRVPAGLLLRDHLHFRVCVLPHVARVR
jgi:hypothetical protein